MRPWSTLSSAPVHTNPWFRIRADRCQRADGVLIDPYYVMETRDWVHVIALTPDQRMIVVRQWRQAAGTFVDEVPGGVREPGEDPLLTAQRELREETGAVSEDWIQVASVHPDPARLNNRVWTFLARDVRFTQPLAWDEHEELEMRLVPFAEIPALIAAGSYTQSTQIASYFLARERLPSAPGE